MFTVLRPNVVYSDEGFSVEIFLPSGLLYTEGLRHLHVNSEVIGMPTGLAIYKNSIKSWAPPNDSEVIDEAKREAIIDNISRVLRYLKLDVLIVEDFS